MTTSSNPPPPSGDPPEEAPAIVRAFRPIGRFFVAIGSFLWANRYFPVALFLAIAVVALAIVTALILLGSPTGQRMRRLDDRRVEDLRGITDAANLYWTRRGSLPLSLEDLSAEPGVNVRSRDRSTGQL